MDLRKTLAIHAVISLVLGITIYYLFRMSVILLAWVPGNAVLANISFPGDSIIRFYLPDFLWCYALCFSLFCIYLPSFKRAPIYSLVGVVYGCIWEYLQYKGFLSGTADFFDCLAYGVASITALCIYNKTKRRKS
ncbi:MAG TPA: hypothetical protein DEW35_03650 [Ruminococcaceae bacterium]|nr:hypothetical protein [Oscillospiraceae bacterium]